MPFFFIFMTEDKHRRSDSGNRCILILVCMAAVIGLFGTASACGGEEFYTSNVLFTNWNAITPIDDSVGSYASQIYENHVTNPTTCVSGVYVFLPVAEQPKPKNVNYLAYAISKYSDKLTKEQYDKLAKALKLKGEDEEVDDEDTLDEEDKEYLRKEAEKEEQEMWEQASQHCDLL